MIPDNNLLSYSYSTASKETPTTNEVRDRLQRELFDALRAGESEVIRSPTSSGKSYIVATTPWQEYPEVTGGQPVIHLNPTQVSRKSAAEKNEQSKATGQELLGRREACPLAGGKYNESIDAPDGTNPSEWFRKMCEGKGIPFSVAHDIFERKQDGPVPCSPCDGIHQWKNIPRDEGGQPSKDVIFTTHEFARTPSLIEDCNVIIDERPDFTKDLTAEDIRKTVTSYLQHIDAPVRRYEDLISDHAHRSTNRFYRSKFDRPDQKWFLENEEAHVLAPGIVDAILSTEKECYDRWVGQVEYRFPDLNPYTDNPEHWVQIRIVVDDDYDINVLQAVPDFSQARCVIGLDAYPTKSKWKANTLSTLEFKRTLTESEEHLWRQDERNLEVVQVGDNKYTWTERGYYEEKVTGLCSELRYQYGDSFASGITSDKFEDKLRENMEASGITEPLTTHFGLEKSVEKFADETVGLVAGCISPSSEQIKDWLALLKKQATPRREVEDDYTGQDWVGPDADVAKELLADVRGNHVKQSVGRYARSPSDPEDGATVYVLTNVLPEQWIDRYVDDVDVLGEKEREILTVLATAPDGLTRREITDKVAASKKHVCNTLDKCRDMSWAKIDEGAGAYNADVFYADRAPDCIAEL